MPASSRGPRRRRSWWCHTCSSTPSTRTPAKRAGSSDVACRHGLMWDHTVFHVVASCRARPAMVAPSKRNCRIAQRIARAPRRARGAHTRSSCSRTVTVWQACSRHIHRRLNHRIRTGTLLLQYRFFRTITQKSQYKTNTFCPLTRKPRAERPGAFLAVERMTGIEPA